MNPPHGFSLLYNILITHLVESLECALQVEVYTVGCGAGMHQLWAPFWFSPKLIICQEKEGIGFFF